MESMAQNSNSESLPAYYRPFLSNRKTAADRIFMGGRQTSPLNGIWHYAVDWYNTCLMNAWYRNIREDDQGNQLPLDYSFIEWKTIKLPCCWNVERKELFYYESSMVFTRTFYFRRNGQNRTYLRIGAANYISLVFINGEIAGLHEGGSTPFYMDITDLLHEGDNNRIIITVDATRSPEYVPMNNTDWFNYGGVYRDIELVDVPAVCVKDFRVGLVPDSDFGLISAAVEINAEMDDTAVLEIPELGISSEIVIRNGRGETVLEAKPELWSPENPKLYDVKLTVKGCGDTVSDRVGFREIKTEGPDILLNGKRTFLKGICVHEETDAHGKALTTEDRLQILKDAKELGCNYIRLSHYPHDEEMAKLADEKGMMLWEELPVYWTMAFSNYDTYDNAANQLEELITRDYNRASVIIWSVGDENPDSNERYSFMSGLVDKARGLDKSRLITGVCSVFEDYTIHDRLSMVVDVISVNENYGWQTADYDGLEKMLTAVHPDKPVIICEFGGGAVYGHHGTIYEKFTEECQADIYRKQVEIIRNSSFLQGMSPWCLYDFRCPRRTSMLQNYYNRGGLITSDRMNHKEAFDILQKFYADYQGPDEIRTASKLAASAASAEAEKKAEDERPAPLRGRRSRGASGAQSARKSRAGKKAK